MTRKITYEVRANDGYGYGIGNSEGKGIEMVRGRIAIVGRLV